MRGGWTHGYGGIDAASGVCGVEAGRKHASGRVRQRVAWVVAHEARGIQVSAGISFCGKAAEDTDGEDTEILAATVNRSVSHRGTERTEKREGRRQRAEGRRTRWGA